MYYTILVLLFTFAWAYNGEIDRKAQKASSFTLARWVVIGFGVIDACYGWLELTGGLPAWPGSLTFLSLAAAAGAPMIWGAYRRDERRKHEEELKRAGGFSDDET